MRNAADPCPEFGFWISDFPTQPSVDTDSAKIDALDASSIQDLDGWKSGLEEFSAEEAAVEEREGGKCDHRDQGEREGELVEGETVSSPENRGKRHH